MAIFPLNPTDGQTIAIGSKSWTYDATYNVWDKVGGDGGTGATGPAGATGATGAAGATGATGLPPGVPYLGLNSVLDAVNSAGDIKITSNQVEVYKTDSNSTDLSNYFNDVNHGRLHIVQEETSENFILFNYNSAPLSSGKYTFAGSIVASNGTGSSSPFFGNKALRIFYVNDGATGPTGPTGPAVDTVGIVVDGSGSVITTGSKGFRWIPYACTVTDAVLIGNTGGTADFAVYRNTSLNLGGATFGGISLNNGQTAQGITDFTTALAENDVLEFKILGTPEAITRASLFIEIEKS